MFLFKRQLIVLVIAVLLTACGGKEERKEKYLERGKEYLEQGNLEKARIEFKNVAQIDPKSAQAFFFLGQVNEKEREWLKAFGNYRHAIEFDPTLVAPRVTMVKIYLAQANSAKSQGDSDSEENMLGLAKEQIHIILDKDAENLEGLALQASVWANEGETNMAAEQLLRVLSSDPEMVSAALLLSDIYTRTDKHAEAEKVLLNTLSNAKDPAVVQSRLVRIYISSGDYDRAEGLLRELVKSHTDELHYRVSLATFLAQLERVDEAEKVLRDAVAADPSDAKRYFLLSDFLSNKQGNEVAIRELEAAIQSHPELDDLKFGLITLYQKNDQIDKASEILEEVIAQQGIKPLGLKAHVILAQLLVASGKGDLDRPKKLLSKVLEENSRDSLALLLRGRIAGKEKRWVDAINNFRAVLKDAPDSNEALKLLTLAHLENNEQILAIDTLKKALDLSPSNVDLRLLLVSILVSKDDYDQALTQVDRVLKINPENQQALSSKFNILALTGDADGMSTVAKLLQAAAPESEDGFVQEARLLYALKKYDESMDMVADIVEKNPSSVSGLMLQSDIFAERKEYESALRVIQKLKQLKPENPLGYLREAKLLIAQKDKKGAISVYKKALAIAPTSEVALSSLTMLQLVEGDVDEVINRLQAVLSENDTSTVANYLLGIAYEKNKNYEKAEEAFVHQIALNQNKADTYSHLATVRLAQGDQDGAIDAYEKGIAVVPGNPGLLLGLASLEEKRRNYNAAIGLYEQLLEAHPQNAIGMNNLASLLSDYKEDSESLSQAIKYAKILEKAKLPAFRDTAAWVYYKTGDIQKAHEIATPVVDEMPDVAIFNYHLGMIYLKNGDVLNARKLLSRAVEKEGFEGVDIARSALEKLQ